MNDTRRIIWNTRERALSSDSNTSADLHARQSINSVVASLSAEHGGPYTNPYGVLQGMIVEATGASLSVTIGVGSAIKYDPTAAGTYDSKYRWLEFDTATAVDLTAYVDGTFARWVCIEIAPGESIETSSLRDIYNTTTGTFTPQTVTKVKRSTPVVTVAAGTPSAAPVMPAGTAGKIPLAYVYIPTSAATIADADVVLCRPVMAPGVQASHESLTGGGVVVESSGGAEIRPRVTNFKPANAGYSIEVDFTGLTEPDLSTANNPNWVTGQTYAALAGATKPVYVYAMSAPYPAGYDANLVSREFYPKSQSTTATRIPSYHEGMTNGILVYSTTAPTSITSTNPVDATALSTGVVDPVWASGPGASSAAQARMVYLGSVNWNDTLSELAAQVVDGGRVRFMGDLNWLRDTDTRTGTSSVGTSGNLTYENPLAKTGDIWSPAGVAEYDIYVTFASIGSTVSTYGLLYDDTNGVTDGTFSSFSTGGGAEVSKSELIHVLTEAGAIIWTHDNTSGGQTTLAVQVTGYKDPYLNRR